MGGNGGLCPHQALQEAEEDVGVQRALVRLVEHDDGVTAAGRWRAKRWEEV